MGEHGATADRDPEFLFDATGFQEPIAPFEFPSERQKRETEG